MSFLTDRKRATGLGASHTGTHHHWLMTVTSVALAVVTPLFIWQVGPLFGLDHDDVVEAFTSPFRAVVTALMLALGFWHMAMGARIMIEDYAKGETRKFAIIAVNLICLAAAVAGLFALARISL
jgi:succinate dehydrogenase / fumarate reductase, membrane anchor subunit